MGGRGNGGARNTGSVTIEVELKDIWGDPIGYDTFDDPEAVKDAVEEMKKSVQEVLEMADNDVDRAYEYLADSYPYALYDDDATKIVNNRDEQNIIAVDVRMNDWDGKVRVTLTPKVFSEDEFYTREELDAIGLTERRR